MDNSPKLKFIAAAIVALAGFGFFVLVLPLYNDMQQARTDLEEHRARLQQRTELVAKVNQLNDQYQKYQEQIKKLDILLPEQKQPDQIVSTFQEMANQSGLNLFGIDIADLTGQTSSANSYKSSIVNLQLIGNYVQFANFLKLLEHNLRLYEVNEISIGQSSGQQKDALNFQLKIYANSIK